MQFHEIFQPLEHRARQFSNHWKMGYLLMTSQEYIEQAGAIVWCQNWPRDLSGMTVRIIDFTGGKSFARLAGGTGYEDLTHWRAVHDRVSTIIRRRGGKVKRIRANCREYDEWRVKHRMNDTRQVRALYLRNYEIEVTTRGSTTHRFSQQLAK